MGRYSRQQATVLGVVLVLVGFASIALGWVGAAATPFVPSQLAYAVSGGLAGLALIGTGAALLNAQVDRIVAADRTAEVDHLIDDTVAILDAVQRP